MIQVTVTLNDSLIIPRLEWMRDNHPEYLLEIMKKEGELERVLLEAVKQARTLQVTLTKQGLDKYQIQEMVMNLIAPAEGMEERETENPISLSLLRRIIESLY